MQFSRGHLIDQRVHVQKHFYSFESVLFCSISFFRTNCVGYYIIQ